MWGDTVSRAMSPPRVPLWASAMALGAGVVWSFGAIVARKADGADAFQYLLWRSVGVIAVIETFALVRHRGSFAVRAFASGWRMWTAMLTLWVSSIGFVYSVKTTSAANAAFLTSTTPIFGVLAGRWLLKERLDKATVALVAVAFSGLVIMVAGDVDAGNTVGNLAAVAAAIAFAGYAVTVRSDATQDWSPVLPGYGVLMILVCGAVLVADGEALVPPGADIAYSLFHGGVLVVVGTICFNTASRRVPAGAMTLFAQSEMALIPILAFVLLDERPTASTLAGGLVIFAAIVAKAILDARRSARTASSLVVAAT